MDSLRIDYDECIGWDDVGFSVDGEVLLVEAGRFGNKRDWSVEAERLELDFISSLSMSEGGED